MRIYRYIYVLLIFLSGQSVSADALTEGRFYLFDATLYADKNDLVPFGIKPIKVVYEREIFGDVKENRLPDINSIKDLALKYKNEEWLILDIERWDIVDSTILDNINLYIEFINIFKKYNSETKVGYYGVLPIRDYWRASKKKGVIKHQEWVDENIKLKQLADVVDAIFPSVYTFYQDKRGWEDFASNQIEMARIIAPGKPVIPFVWPDYHDSNKTFAHRYIGDEYWRFQLDTILSHADGVVIWGGWDSKNWRPATWDDNFRWWKVTKEFIKSKNNI